MSACITAKRPPGRANPASLGRFLSISISAFGQFSTVSFVTASDHPRPRAHGVKNRGAADVAGMYCIVATGNLPGDTRIEIAVRVGNQGDRGGGPPVLPAHVFEKYSLGVAWKELLE